MSHQKAIMGLVQTATNAVHLNDHKAAEAVRRQTYKLVMRSAGDDELYPLARRAEAWATAAVFYLLKQKYECPLVNALPKNGGPVEGGPKTVVVGFLEVDEAHHVEKHGAVRVSHINYPQVIGRAHRMREVPIAELTGAALDWAVAIAIGLKPEICQHYPHPPFVTVLSYPEGFKPDYFRGIGNGGPFKPCTDWAQGGPLKEREKIITAFLDNHWCAFCIDGIADRVGGLGADYIDVDYNDADATGESELQAAMRAIVTKLTGKTTVAVPLRLLESV